MKITIQYLVSALTLLSFQDKYLLRPLFPPASASFRFCSITEAVSNARSTFFTNSGDRINGGMTGLKISNFAMNKCAAAVPDTVMFPDELLPLNWLYFRAKNIAGQVFLEWGTINQLNNGFFTLEKSSDGKEFQMLTTVLVPVETKNSEYRYSFTDRLSSSFCYYRLSETDKDGLKDHYKTIAVLVNANPGFKGIYYMNRRFIYVQASGAAPGNGSIKLYCMDGRLMSSQNITLTREISTYSIDRPFRAGIYLIRIESRGENLYSSKVQIF